MKALRICQKPEKGFLNIKLPESFAENNQLEIIIISFDKENQLSENEFRPSDYFGIWRDKNIDADKVCKEMRDNNHLFYITTKRFNEKLTDMLKTDARFVDDEGELVKAAVIDRAWKIDRDLVKLLLGKPDTNSLSKTVFSVKPLFKRFKRFEKSLYDLKRPIFESELV